VSYGLIPLSRVADFVNSFFDRQGSVLKEFWSPEMLMGASYFEVQENMMERNDTR
jgi:hypothetical protein